MTLKTQLVDVHSRELHTEDYWSLRHANLGDQVVLVSATPPAVHGTFKSATRASAGTTTITSPTANGSLLITDILISGEKANSATTEVRFTDGSNNVTLFLTQQVDFAANLGVGFQGRVQGWKDARIDMITTGTQDVTVLVCYTKVPEGLPFAEWDALR